MFGDESLRAALAQKLHSEFAWVYGFAGSTPVHVAFARSFINREKRSLQWRPLSGGALLLCLWNAAAH